MLKDLKVSRRFALRGALSGIGVSLWLPVLDAMCNDNGTAFAQGAPLPTTFGIWFWGNGIHPQYWTPQASGTGDQWQLPPNLEPFQSLKQHMTLITGLDMLDAQFKGHGWGAAYVLAGGDGKPATRTSDIDSHGVTFEQDTSTQNAPTLDQIIADAIGGDTPFASLETGVCEYRGINMGTVSQNLAHRGPYDFLPPERDPRALYDRLFGDGVPDTGTDPGLPSDIVRQLRVSALDAVLDDANSLRQKLGAQDASRLDRHMESIRAVEERIAAATDEPETGSMGCTAPSEPTDPNDKTERSQALNRLVTMALACNLTRVYSHLWSGARDDNTYPEIGINGDHHGLTHEPNNVSQDQAAEIEKYIMEQYADMATVMSETSLGDSTVLDNTLLYGVSDVAEPQGHVMSNYHIVVMGHAGGQLPGDMHLRFPGRKVTELMLTMQQVMGLEVDSYGSWDNTSTTISEMLA